MIHEVWYPSGRTLVSCETGLLEGVRRHQTPQTDNRHERSPALDRRVDQSHDCSWQGHSQMTDALGYTEEDLRDLEEHEATEGQYELGSAQSISQMEWSMMGQPAHDVQVPHVPADERSDHEPEALLIDTECAHHQATQSRKRKSHEHENPEHDEQPPQ
eukprot:3397839-Prymnesium_polylepis.3